MAEPAVEALVGVPRPSGIDRRRIAAEDFALPGTEHEGRTSACLRAAAYAKALSVMWRATPSSCRQAGGNLDHQHGCRDAHDEARTSLAGDVAGIEDVVVLPCARSCGYMPVFFKRFRCSARFAPEQTHRVNSSAAAGT
jgi:hypothetical protein